MVGAVVAVPIAAAVPASAVVIAEHAVAPGAGETVVVNPVLQDAGAAVAGQRVAALAENGPDVLGGDLHLQSPCDDRKFAQSEFRCKEKSSRGAKKFAGGRERAMLRP